MYTQFQAIVWYRVGGEYHSLQIDLPVFCNLPEDSPLDALFLAICIDTSLLLDATSQDVVESQESRFILSEPAPGC